MVDVLHSAEEEDCFTSFTWSTTPNMKVSSLSHQGFTIKPFQVASANDVSISHCEAILDGLWIFMAYDGHQSSRLAIGHKAHHFFPIDGRLCPLCPVPASSLRWRKDLLSWKKTSVIVALEAPKYIMLRQYSNPVRWCCIIPATWWFRSENRLFLMISNDFHCFLLSRPELSTVE